LITRSERDMEEKILVAYATKYGATAEIAENIGEVLREKNFQVDVLPPNQVRNLKSYAAVVLGSAVYIGQWRKEAVKFLKNGEEVLSTLPVWLFSSGPAGEGDPGELVKGWRYPKGLQAVIERIRPRDIVIFHGALNREKMNFFESWIIKNVKSPIGDFRDWSAIKSWAESIAAELEKQS
jgi:menaquinone-dependent protoporphyrinogen oxidase